MSTYWGYVCRSHDPEIESDDWFNRGDQLLREVFLKERSGEWPNDPSFEFWDEPMAVEYQGSETSAPIRWLRHHPRCDIALRNEYGDTKEIGEPDAEEV